MGDRAVGITTRHAAALMRCAGRRCRRTVGALGYAAVICVPAPHVCAASPPALPADQEAAEKLLAIGGEGFRIRETDHFTIAYDTPYDLVRPLTGRLEGTFDAVWAFCEANKLAPQLPASRFEVLLFDRVEDFRKYRTSIGLPGEGIATGFYWPETNIAVFLNTLSRPEVAQITNRIEQTMAKLKASSADGSSGKSARARRRSLRRALTALRTGRDNIVEQFNRSVLQHEAAHQMLFNIGVHVRGAENPRWFVEGLACQFEVAQGGAGASLKRVNHMRLADLRDALGVEPAAKSCTDALYQAALDSGRLLGLSDLIGNPKIFTHADAGTVLRYAQAWGLVYYLNREHRDAFGEYARVLSSRRPGERADRTREIDDFVSAFGPLDRGLERTWVDYMLKLRYDPRQAGR